MIPSQIELYAGGYAPANQPGIHVCTFDDATGGVTVRDSFAGIQISPSGDRLYVSNRGHDSISIFEIEADGSLVRLAIRPCGGKRPRNITISPGGHFLLVANQESNEVVVLPVLGGVEALGAPIARISASGASCVHFVQA